MTDTTVPPLHQRVWAIWALAISSGAIGIGLCKGSAIVLIVGLFVFLLSFCESFVKESIFLTMMGRSPKKEV